MSLFSSDAYGDEAPQLPIDLTGDLESLAATAATVADEAFLDAPDEIVDVVEPVAAPAIVTPAIVEPAHAELAAVGRARQCSRPDCSASAEVTLTYEYRTSHVWLDTLTDERDPHAYDLCGHHAAELKVPIGWTLSDRCHSVGVAQRLAG